MLEVFGLPWCKTEPVNVGRANVVSKILCIAHNNALSDVDAAGITAFQTFKSVVELQDRRRRVGHLRLIPQCFPIDGPLLERWFLKTSINLILAQDDEITWYDGIARRHPPDELVDAAYGRRVLTRGAGLYAAASVGESGVSGESVQFHPLFDMGDRLSGAKFSFRGFRFLLSFREGNHPRRLSIGTDPTSPWFDTEVVYHIERFRFAIGSQLSHFAYFNWPERLSAHFFDADSWNAP